MKQLLFHWTAKTKACCVSRQRERRRGLLLCLRKPVLSFHAVPQPGLRTVLAPQSWLKCCSVVRWPGMQRVWSVSHNYQKIRLNIYFWHFAPLAYKGVLGPGPRLQLPAGFQGWLLAAPCCETPQAALLRAFWDPFPSTQCPWLPRGSKARACWPTCGL